jgi:hypothetical protein
VRSPSSQFIEEAISMAWYFIIPLGIALVVNYILKHATDEIAYIATAILVVSLVISLMMAPWQLQGLLVLLVLVSNIRIWQKDEDAIDEFTEPEQNINGRGSDSVASVPDLSYRGINYKVSSKSQAAVDEELNKPKTIIGKYRGQLLKSYSPKNIQGQPTENPNFEIQYRGVKVKYHKSSVTESQEQTSVNS